MAVYYPASLAEVLLRFHEPQQLLTVAEPQIGGVVSPVPAGQPCGELVTVDPLDPYSAQLLFYPQRVEWELNGAREADTGRVKLAFSDLPFDPRSVRSAVLAIYAGTVDAGTYDRWAHGLATGLIERSQRNLRFIGHVDEWPTEFGEGGDSVTISARDFTAIMLDQDVPSAVLRALSLASPLLQVVTEIVRSLPALVRMPVVADDPEIALMPLALDALRNVGGAKGRSAGGERVRYWDLITDICALSGVLPVVRLDTLHLIRPRTYYLGSALSTPTMVWGGNLKRLRIERRFGRGQEQGIEVRCFDPGSKTTHSARYPARAVKATPGGQGSSEVYTVKTVHGVAPGKLAALAEAIYLEAAHRQLEVILETADLSSFGGGNSSPDLLDLQPGSPVNVEVADLRNEAGRLPLFRPATLAEVAASSPAELAQLLTSRGVNSRVAPVLARALRSANRLSTFRTSSVKHSLDHEGYSCEIRATSYLEAH